MKIAEKRRDAKGEGEKERYTYLNAEFQKNIYFCFIDYAKALTMWITINCGKF